MHTPQARHWTNGAAGVDIFFVISGFVMAISLPGLAGKPHKAAVFLKRRFTRIVPLYWIALTVQLPLITLNRMAARENVLTPWRVAASYLFIPARNSRGQMFPLLTVGWTLNFEVFFYLLFAAALALNVSPLAFLTPVLVAVAMVGLARTAAWPDFTSLASPVVLEFLFGVVLAHLAMRRKLPATAWAAALLAAGLTALMLMPEVPQPWGSLAWGLSATAVVAGALGLEGAIGGRLPKWMLEAGDASYALYLMHNFILPYPVDLLRALHVTGTPALVGAIVMGLGICFPASVLLHRHLEKPLMNHFKKPRAMAPLSPLPVLPQVAPVLAEEL